MHNSIPNEVVYFLETSGLFKKLSKHVYFLKKTEYTFSLPARLWSGKDSNGILRIISFEEVLLNSPDSIKTLLIINLDGLARLEDQVLRESISRIEKIRIF